MTVYTGAIAPGLSVLRDNFMTRHRSTVLGDNLTTHYWTVFNGGTQINQYVYHYQNLETKEISDELTPGYTQKVKEGSFLPINPTDIKYYKQELLSPFSGTADNGSLHIEGEFLVWSGAISGGAEYVPDQGDLDYAVIKALAKAKQPDWDLLTFLGEFPQTVDLLKLNLNRLSGIAKRLAEIARRKTLRRARRKKRKYSYFEALQEFNRLWLEARYAWRPLIYDVQDILSLLSEKSKVTLSRRSATHTVDVSTDASHVYDAGTTRYSEVTTRRGSCKIRAVVFHRSDMSRIGANPVVTWWELTKYSFVIDWFIDIGSWLQAISPRVGYNQLGVSLSWTTKMTYYESSTVVGQGGWTLNAGEMVRKITRNDYHRENYTSVPLPSFQVRLDSLKVVDIAALALQSLGQVSNILRL